MAFRIRIHGCDGLLCTMIENQEKTMKFGKRMRRIPAAILMIGLAVLFTSCSKSYDPVNESSSEVNLAIYPEELNSNLFRDPDTDDFYYYWDLNISLSEINGMRTEIKEIEWVFYDDNIENEGADICFRLVDGPETIEQLFGKTRIEAFETLNSRPIRLFNGFQTYYYVSVTVRMTDCTASGVFIATNEEGIKQDCGNPGVMYQ